ncbi:uncharacterized protein PITG_03271 [Phytophthora infestans T30-4]|uniref:PPM-type phosphatase domain-containing protein n=1 Tax=Phytophthora infestans (strain T30-4) TaxID=403677 RepID=D0MZT4_PHYIT|nr:uncharacterized protein PITG_03271 [Phytophthora infestans T30-4]EEY65747.1 conserved hypothetical protein [Phytophthora infestans T30-4]|eukprot:XP_002906346.1 conserved hypothetical protein [Phytophthora infestans T30-4]
MQVLVDQLTDTISQKWYHEQHGHFLKSFKEAFDRVDSQILQKNSSQDGSTALLVWFLADTIRLYTVNVGDCRAVMCRGGRGVALTSDHKPDRPDEQQRIEKAGGFKSTYLAVSRAFGDRSLKTPTSLVSCEPEVKRVTVQDDDLFLVLACDGVWDVLSEQEAR